MTRFACPALALLALASASATANEPPQTPAMNTTAALRLPPNAPVVAQKIIGAARADHHVWDRVADLCDRVGPRSAGTPGYARAMEWALAEFKRDGLENAHREDVVVKGWVRGAESLTLEKPGLPRTLPVTTLGRSVGTPAGGITAPAIVVRDFAELDAKGEAVRGKIVVYDVPMPVKASGFAAYGETVVYRWSGASRAAKYGAAAVLVRSLATLRARSPHTGAMGYDEKLPKIPAGSITIEDAEMLHRMQDKGLTPVLHLVLDVKEQGPVTEGNIVAEIRGREKPDEIVVIGGHLDSWDLACGAHDDGAGVALTLDAMRLLKQLGLQPRRTIRAVLFDNEERGLEGGRTYLETHRAELARHVAAMESDSGGFRPIGFSVQGGVGATDMLDPLLAVFSPVGHLAVRRGGGGSDISPIVGQGVPGIGFNVDGTHYFDYHHSALDTPDKIDPDELNDSLAAYTLMAWLLAESPDTLPRGELKKDE